MHCGGRYIIRGSACPRVCISLLLCGYGIHKDVGAAYSSGQLRFFGDSLGSAGLCLVRALGVGAPQRSLQPLRPPCAILYAISARELCRRPQRPKERRRP
jgi:hypothetical protein